MITYRKQPELTSWVLNAQTWEITYCAGKVRQTFRIRIMQIKQFVFRIQNGNTK